MALHAVRKYGPALVLAVIGIVILVDIFDKKITDDAVIHVIVYIVFSSVLLARRGAK